MIYYQIIFEDKFNMQRYKSSCLFTQNELLNNDINLIKKNEYLLRYPDKYLLSKEYLDDELKQVKDICTVPIDVNLN